jgi:hypothetical protein
MYINLERSRPSMANRLGMVNRALGFDPRRPLLMRNSRGKNLIDIKDACKRAMGELGVEGFVLDSISRTGEGSMIKDDSVNRIMDTCNWLAGDGFWIGLGHTSRGDETHIYGNTMFDAAGDVMCVMLSETKPDGTLGVGLRVVKTNDFRPRPLKIWAYEFDDDAGLTGVRVAREHEFNAIEHAGSAPRDVLIAHILREGPLSASEAHETYGFDRANTSRLFNNDPAFYFVRMEGKNKLYGYNPAGVVAAPEPPTKLPGQPEPLDQIPF